MSLACTDSAGGSLGTADGYAKSSRVEHHPVVASVADGDDVVCAQILHEVALGLGLVPRIHDDQRTRQSLQLHRRAAKSVRGHDVHAQLGAQVPDSLLHAFEQQAVGSQRTVVVEDGVG